MAITPSEVSVQNIRDFFTSKFTAPSAPNQVAEDVWKALEAPIFKQNIFASSFLGIIDHSNMSYRYLSPKALDFYGIETSVLMEKGPNFMLSLILPEDSAALFPMYEKVSNIVMSLPKEDCLHFHLDYDCRVNTPAGMICIYQQTIPLALNDDGYPYLMLTVCSDVTEFKTDDEVHYKASLNLPGEPAKVLILGNTQRSVAPFTDREKEIVHQLADGHDSQAIADKLFISHDTVRTHRRNILEKTGAKNTVHLVRLAVANGWI